jgi:hypothetical protein
VNGVADVVVKVAGVTASPAMAKPPVGREVAVRPPAGPIVTLPAPESGLATAARTSSMPAAAIVVGPVESAVAWATCSVPELTVTPPVKVFAVPSTITPGPSVVNATVPDTGTPTTSG